MLNLKLPLNSRRVRLVLVKKVAPRKKQIQRRSKTQKGRMITSSRQIKAEGGNEQDEESGGSMALNHQEREKEDTSMKRQFVNPDNEHGVARGIDLLGVARALNFDLSYQHLQWDVRTAFDSLCARGAAGQPFLSCSHYPSLTSTKRPVAFRAHDTAR